MGLFSSLFGNNSNVQLAERVKEGAFLVDVRSPGEFASGSVNGAVNIPLDSIAKHLDKFNGKNNIVVFCRSGSRSSMAKDILEKNGFSNVINGGTWQDVRSALS
jgi:rhodanese-related sulfurtransferase